MSDTHSDKVNRYQYCQITMRGFIVDEASEHAIVWVSLGRAGYKSRAELRFVCDSCHLCGPGLERESRELLPQAPQQTVKDTVQPSQGKVSPELNT